MSTSDRSIVESFLNDFDEKGEEETEGDDEYFVDARGAKLSEPSVLPMPMNYHHLIKAENDAFSGNIPYADGLDKNVGQNEDSFK